MSESAAAVTAAPPAGTTTTTSTSSNNNSSGGSGIAVPWVEKYRPETMADIVGNEEAIARLRVVAREGNLPNLLLCGPPGTGKTTSMLCLARDLLSKELGNDGSGNNGGNNNSAAAAAAAAGAGAAANTGSNGGAAAAAAGGAASASGNAGSLRAALQGAVLELNASDDRGLDVVRERIKLFAQTRKTLPTKFVADGGGGGRQVRLHKIVILDEADSMTPAAQQALRRTMELHSGTTRFAFACNNSSRIIEPIQSRCAVVRFRRLTEREVLGRLLAIIAAEGVDYTDDGLEALLYIAEGDLRQAVNALQATATGYGRVTADNVFKVCDQPHPALVENILRACLVAKDIGAAHKELQRLLHRGYAPADVMATFYKVAQTAPALFRSEMQQLRVLRAIGEATMRVAEGVATGLQLAAMLARIIGASSDAAEGDGGL